MDGESWKSEGGHTPTYEDMVKYIHHKQVLLVSSERLVFPMEICPLELPKNGQFVKFKTSGGMFSQVYWLPLFELNVIQLIVNLADIMCVPSKTKKHPVFTAKTLEEFNNWSLAAHKPVSKQPKKPKKPKKNEQQ